MVFSRYARFMFAPDDGASGGGAGVSANGTDGEGATDYKALYEKTVASLEKEVAERAKLKKSFDATASEIAELKKAQKATMTEQQLKEAENAEKEQRYKALQSEVNEMRTSTAFAKAGFDEKDYGDIVKKIVEVGGEKSGELANTLIEFVKKSNASAVASAKNALIKDGAVAPKTSTANTGNAKSDYQLYQESKTKSNNIVEL